MKRRRKELTITSAMLVLVVAAFWIWSPRLSDSENARPPVESALPGESQVTVRESGSQTHAMQVGRGDVIEIPDVQDVDVQFPSGETVRVSLVNFAPPVPPIAYAHRISDMYDQLVDAAVAGNGAAARELYGALKGCRQAFADEKSMLAAVSHLRETGEVTYPDDETRIHHVDVGLDTGPVEEMIRETYERCDGITTEQKEGAEHWLEIAADEEDYLAMREYARYLGSNTRESFELRQKTWEMGFVSGAGSIAIYYKNGDQVDYLKSYAYSLISSQIYKAALLRDGSRHSRYGTQVHNKIKSLDDLLSTKAGYLTPEQQAAAEQIAIDLLKANTNCCRAGWSGY